MPYDSSLDECLFSKSYQTETERLTVSVHSYNKGTKKLQISRENKSNQDDFKFAKLGRMTKEEVKSLLPLLGEALNHMD
jgi:DNA-directed RNA polymerase alpha subunit